MAEIRDWAALAANNNFAPDEGGWPEGMLLREVNNAARATIAALCRWFLDNNGSLSATVVSNTTVGTIYEVTPNASMVALGEALPSYYDRLTLAFTPAAANLGPARLRVAGLADFPLVNTEGMTIEAGVIKQGLVYGVIFQESANRWVAFNAVAQDLSIQRINTLAGAPSEMFVSGDVTTLGRTSLGTDVQLDTASMTPAGVGTQYPLTIANADPAAPQTIAESTHHFFLGYQGSEEDLLARIGFDGARNFLIESLVSAARLRMRAGGNTVFDADPFIGTLDLFIPTVATALLTANNTGLVRLSRSPVGGPARTILESTVAAGTVFGNALDDLVINAIDLAINATNVTINSTNAFTFGSSGSIEFTSTNGPVDLSINPSGLDLANTAFGQGVRVDSGGVMRPLNGGSIQKDRTRVVALSGAGPFTIGSADFNARTLLDTTAVTSPSVVLSIAASSNVGDKIQLTVYAGSLLIAQVQPIGVAVLRGETQPPLVRTFRWVEDPPGSGIFSSQQAVTRPANYRSVELICVAPNEWIVLWRDPVVSYVDSDLSGR